MALEESVTDTPATSQDAKVGSVNVLDHITKNRTLPDGYQQWAFRAVRPDMTSSRGYKYPFPGNVAVAPGPIIAGNKGECPTSGTVGDGICAATTYAGMASAGIVARSVLLVAYRDADVLGGSRAGGKLRLREFLVVDLIDGEKLLADLAAANLTGANLTGAYLAAANLTRANLTGAYLAAANLTRANLTEASLTKASLTGANLTKANLAAANLTAANLTGANLTGANLTGAYLAAANLTGAYLTLPAGWKLNESGLAVRA